MVLRPLTPGFGNAQPMRLEVNKAVGTKRDFLIPLTLFLYKVNKTKLNDIVAGKRHVVRRVIFKINSALK
jgi:hypothetical protein